MRSSNRWNWWRHSGMSLTLQVVTLTCGLFSWLGGWRILIQWRRHRRRGSDPHVQKIPWRRKMVTHSSILAEKVSRTEEPGRLQSAGPRGAAHGWAAEHTLTCALSQAAGRMVGPNQLCIRVRDAPDSSCPRRQQIPLTTWSQQGHPENSYCRRRDFPFMQ